MAPVGKSNDHDHGHGSGRSSRQHLQPFKSNPLFALPPLMATRRNANHRQNTFNFIGPSSEHTHSSALVSKKGKRAALNPRNDQFNADFDDDAVEAPKRAGVKRKQSVDFHERFEAFRQVRARYRSPTPPMDDYPVPVIDDMTWPLNLQTYKRNRSGKATNQTPSEYEEGRQEYYKRREQRRMKDDLDMFKGLKQFKGQQRGWDGRTEAERRMSEEKRHQVTRAAQVHVNRYRFASDERKSTTAKELEDSMEAYASSFEIAAIGLADHVRFQEQRNRREMAKTRWDPEAIREAALEEKHGDNTTNILLEDKTSDTHNSDRHLLEIFAENSVPGLGSPRHLANDALAMNSPPSPAMQMQPGFDHLADPSGET